MNHTATLPACVLTAALAFALPFTAYAAGIPHEPDPAVTEGAFVNSPGLGPAVLGYPGTDVAAVDIGRLLSQRAPQEWFATHLASIGPWSPSHVDPAGLDTAIVEPTTPHVDTGGPVPEPATASLLGLGIAGMALSLRGRRAR